MTRRDSAQRDGQQYAEPLVKKNHIVSDHFGTGQGPDKIGQVIDRSLLDNRSPVCQLAMAIYFGYSPGSRSVWIARVFSGFSVF